MNLGYISTGKWGTQSAKCLLCPRCTQRSSSGTCFCRGINASRRNCRDRKEGRSEWCSCFSPVWSPAILAWRFASHPQEFVFLRLKVIDFHNYIKALKTARAAPAFSPFVLLAKPNLMPTFFSSHWMHIFPPGLIQTAPWPFFSN